MKTIHKSILGVAAVLAVLAFGFRDGLQRQLVEQVYNRLGYSNSDADTTRVLSIGGTHHVALRIKYDDSVSVVYKFDQRVKGVTAWTAVTAVSADTVIDAGGSASFKQIILRDNTTERITGVSTEFRVRAAFASSGNSANSGAKHDGFLEYY